jgi:hypothetical protein
LNNIAVDLSQSAAADLKSQIFPWPATKQAAANPPTESRNPGPRPPRNREIIPASETF